MANCTNLTNEADPDKFNITQNCAAFDFGIYTVIGGSLCLSGLFGNIISFTVLWRDSTKAATPLLLRALAVADCLVLLAALPIYVLAFVYPYTNLLYSCYHLYVNLLPYLWPCYLIPYTGKNCYQTRSKQEQEIKIPVNSALV